MLLTESGLAMLVASAAIRLVAPRRLLPALCGHKAHESAPARTTDAATIRRAIEAWARRLPWRTMCFEQGLAAHWMLRRRGLESTLCYGAATIDGELKAHVWVKSGDQDVIGCESAGDYALIARFPEP